MMHTSITSAACMSWAMAPLLAPTAGCHLAASCFELLALTSRQHDAKVLINKPHAQIPKC
jgi:hypothetical protein